ncbi:hypothetical protein ACXN5S_00200 [Pseudoroseicyclus sp. H15]
MWQYLLIEGAAGGISGLFIGLIVLRFRVMVPAGVLGGLLAGRIWASVRPTGLVDTAGVTPSVDLSVPALVPHVLAGGVGGLALAGLIALAMGRRARR